MAYRRKENRTLDEILTIYGNWNDVLLKVTGAVLCVHCPAASAVAGL